MEFRRIVLRKEERGYHVLIDGKFYSGILSIEEALGCIASALFSEKPLFATRLPITSVEESRVVQEEFALEERM